MGGGGGEVEGEGLLATSFSVMNMVAVSVGGVVVGSDELAGIDVVGISFGFSLVICFAASSATIGLFSSVGEASGEVVACCGEAVPCGGGGEPGGGGGASFG